MNTQSCVQLCGDIDPEQRSMKVNELRKLLITLIPHWKDSEIVQSQCIELFTEVCRLNGWVPDTSNYDEFVLGLYNHVEKLNVDLADFDLALGQYL